MNDADGLTGLNRRYGIANELIFRRGSGGLIFAEIDNPLARATLVLQGAQILSWNPTGHPPVFWLSPEARFESGHAIRGGVPICWPWFGNHTVKPERPPHGFARTMPWEVLESARLDDGATQLMLKLLTNSATQELWPHQTPVELLLTIGNTLTLELKTLNIGPAPVTIEQALHAYFTVGDVRQVRLAGLEACTYIDKLDQDRPKTQAGNLRFDEEIDRVYLDTAVDCLIEDPVLRRRIRIAKRGSRSTVVWNPWETKAAQLGDFPAEGHLGMLCVESSNTDRDAITLGPYGEHRLSACYSVEPLLD